MPTGLNVERLDLILYVFTSRRVIYEFVNFSACCSFSLLPTDRFLVPENGDRADTTSLVAKASLPRPHPAVSDFCIGKACV